MIFVLGNNGQFPEEAEGNDEQMEVVPFEAPGQDLYEPCFSHFFFDGGVGADVEEDVEADEEEFVLFPDEDVEFFELGAGGDAVVFVVAAPHFDVLGVEQVEALDLVFEHFHDGDAHFVFGQQLLELLVVAQNVEHAQDVHRQVDVALVVLGQGPTQHRQQGIFIVAQLPCSSNFYRFPKS